VKIDRSISPCPQCHRADDVLPPSLNPDGNLEFVCTDKHQGAGPVVFLRMTPSVREVNDSRSSSGGAGVKLVEPRITDDLLDPMRACIEPADGWVEYGVLEHRLRERAPEIFARHVAEAGHIMFGPKTSTASGVRFAMALRRLAAAGHLESQIRRSTGDAWKHDNIISFWRAVPEGPDAASTLTPNTLTWADYCARLGRSDAWTETDRAGLVDATRSEQADEPA
jgi:hypothetical protein